CWARAVPAMLGLGAVITATVGLTLGPPWSPDLLARLCVLVPLPLWLGCAIALNLVAQALPTRGVVRVVVVTTPPVVSFGGAVAALAAVASAAPIGAWWWAVSGGLLAGSGVQFLLLLRAVHRAEPKYLVRPPDGASGVAPRQAQAAPRPRGARQVAP